MSSVDASQPGQGSLHPDELTDSSGKEALNELPDKVWGQAGLHPRSGIILRAGFTMAHTAHVRRASANKGPPQIDKFNFIV